MDDRKMFSSKVLFICYVGGEVSGPDVKDNIGDKESGRVNGVSCAERMPESKDDDIGEVVVAIVVFAL